MTAHIIGKLPAPKGGATFGDVPRPGLFHWAGQDWSVDVKGRVTRISDGWRPKSSPGPNDRVVLLGLTPRDPEPDPAVTTYGELKLGLNGLHVDPDYGELCILTESSPLTIVSLGTGAPKYPAPGDPVRRVAASVVVHEEPGTHLRAALNGTGVLLVEGPAKIIPWDQLRAIVQQGAALLAQEPASPESGEPYRMTTEQGRAVHQALVGSVEEDDFVGEPAEDRSKPAPGYDRPDHGGKGWYSRGPDRHLFGPFDTPKQLIAATWAKHDAQQAGKGGES